MENLSQWFKLKKQPPWEPGVYGVKSVDGNLGFSYYDGSIFHFFFKTVDPSFDYYSRGYKGGSGWMVVEWRGLSNPPIDPKHLARRTDPQTSKDAAIMAVSTGHIATHCERIWACLGEYGNQNANEVAARLGLHAHQVLKRFSDLHKMKKASRTGEVRQGQSVWNAI